MGVLGENPKKGLFGPFGAFLEALGRDSGGVRRESDRGLRKGGRRWEEEKKRKRVERAKRPDLER